MCHPTSLHPAGFEPRRAVSFAEIAVTGSGLEFELVTK
jgi:hypothetical protein